LYVLAMGKAFVRFRNPRRRAIGKHHTAFYNRMWKDAAEELGGTFEQLNDEIGEIRIDGFRTRVIENTCAIDDPVTLAVLADKPLTYRVLQDEGLNTPRHSTFSLKNLQPALDFISMTGRDCVVKPANGTGGGRGVTTGIRTPWQLARAAAAAAVYGDQLLIEEQITGDNYRLLYLDGELIDAFVRRLPSVVGDGKSTIASLIQRENDQRLRAGSGQSQVLLTIDLDMRRTLDKQGYSLRSVPPDGQQINVKTVVNENCGQDNVTVTHELDPSIVEDGARAARALGVRLAGVDIITTDRSVPLQQSGGVVLEVNAPPNYYYHYKKPDGEFRVATHVLTRLLEQHAEMQTTLSR
jgi:cyanophycin synthetase